MFTSARNLSTRTCLAITLFAPPLWGSWAVAEPAPTSTVVHYRDLDLSTDAGVQALYARIETAARHVCVLETNEHPGADQRERYFDCYRVAVANAVKQIGQPGLVTLHHERALARE